MEELLKLIKDTIAQCKNVCATMQSAVGLAKEMTEKAVVKIKIADDKETLNTKASEYLVQRELKVEKIENVVKLDEESKTRERVTKELIAKLEKDQTTFETFKRNSLKEISEKGAKATSALNEANREWKLLNEEKVKFAEDKKNMREDILKELKDLK